MPSTLLAPGTAVSGGCRNKYGFVLVILALLEGRAGSVRAELLGTHPQRNGTVHLMSELCSKVDPIAGQLAWQTVATRKRPGYWGVEHATGNPVVTWSDGIELLLDRRKVRWASLWWPYRRTLSLAAEAWHKSDYFHWLKACGADKACIAGEQET